MLDKRIYPDPKVQEFLNTTFVSVKLNADTPVAKAIMRQYSMRGIPALLVFQGNGQLRGKVSGAPSNPDGFIQYVTQLANGQGQ